MERTRAENVAVPSLAALLAAAGQPDRLAILSALAGRSDGVAVGEIQAAVGLPASTLSYHLERLRRVGWVTVRRQGPFLWHQLDPGALSTVLRLLSGLGRKRELKEEPRRVGRGAWAKRTRVRSAGALAERTSAVADLEIEFD